MKHGLGLGHVCQEGVVKGGERAGEQGRVVEDDWWTFEQEQRRVERAGSHLPRGCGQRWWEGRQARGRGQGWQDG